MLSLKPEHIPKPLSQGSEVITVAVSSNLNNEESLINGLTILESWGLICRKQNVIAHQWGYLAGNDSIRFNSLHPKKSADLKAFARGGWGGARLLERDQPWETGWLLGFSDVSSILLSRLAAGFGGGIHGPLLTSLPEEPEWSKDRLKSILFGKPVPDLHGKSWTKGYAIGPLVACNLSVASHLIGSRHMPNLEGAILVLEDVGEEPYRIDRMLTHWRLNGLLQGLAGLAFGNFVNCINSTYNKDNQGFDIKEVLRERSMDLNIPVMSNLPIGHSPGNASLPLGRSALLDCNKEILRVFPS